MKKFLILIILLLMVNPVFAGNVLQQQAELKLLQTHFNKNYFPVKADKIYLIKEDYQVYLSNGDSIYGRIVETIDDIKKSNIPNKQLNLNYLELLLNKLNTVISIQDSTFNNQRFTDTVLTKIIIDDNDYNKLTPKVKEHLNKGNIIFLK